VNIEYQVPGVVHALGVAAASMPSLNTLIAARRCR
jgi:hypothetical protein